MRRFLFSTLSLGLILLLGACSSSPKTEGEEVPDALPPLADAGTDSIPQSAPEDPMASEALPAADPAPPAPVAEPAQSFEGGGQFENYTVQQGDTLMRIAFETYGDLYRWKEIYHQNQDKIADPNAVPAGTVLKVEKPAPPVTIDRNGERYLIRSGDTLGTISNDVYGTSSKWRKLWENNRQLIRDPNKIFAGFYLYYLPDGSAPLAGSPPDQRNPAANPGAAAVPPANDVPPPGDIPPPISE